MNCVWTPTYSRCRLPASGAGLTYWGSLVLGSPFNVLWVGNNWQSMQPFVDGNKVYNLFSILCYLFILLPFVSYCLSIPLQFLWNLSFNIYVPQRYPLYGTGITNLHPWQHYSSQPFHVLVSFLPIYVWIRGLFREKCKIGNVHVMVVVAVVSLFHSSLF